MAEQVLTQEEENYLRMSLLLTGISPRAARVFFDSEFDPSCLDSSIKKEYNKLRDLQLKRIINMSQWKLLFPRYPDTPDSKTFDVTLIITLIRHLTDLQPSYSGFDRLPSPSDVSPCSDLARIKYYRNFLAHLDDGKVANTVFKDAWNNITDAVSRLGGQRMGEECNRLLYKLLDQNNYEVMNDIRNSRSEIRELKMSIEELHENHRWMSQDMKRLKSNQEDKIPLSVREVHKEEVKRWKLEDNNFLRTTSSSKLFELINKQDVSVVTVVGPKHCGKSCLAKHVALKMKEEYAYIIIPVHEIKEVIEWYDSNKKQLFVFDDVCSSEYLLDETVKNWNSRSTALQTRLDHNIFKMIACCSADIYRSPKFREINVLCEHEFDFRDDDNLLSDEDIESIAREYLKEEEVVKILNIKEDLKKLHNLPMLCKRFADENLENPIQFFSHNLSLTQPVNAITDVSINSSTSLTSNLQQSVQGMFMYSTVTNSPFSVHFHQHS